MVASELSCSSQANSLTSSSDVLDTPTVDRFVEKVRNRWKLSWTASDKLEDTEQVSS